MKTVRLTLRPALKADRRLPPTAVMCQPSRARVRITCQAMTMSNATTKEKGTPKTLPSPMKYQRSESGKPAEICTA